MNILIFNWKDLRNPEVGGAEIINFELSRRLVRDGHAVTWFCRRFKGCSLEDEIEGIRIIRRGGILTIYIKAFLYYKRLRRKPDLVIDMINTIPFMTPLYMDGVKKVGYLNQMAKEVFFCQLPFPISRICYYLEPWFYRFYKKSYFLCYSQGTREDLVSSGILKEKVKMFSLGVDHGRYIPGEKVDYPLFVFIGRLVRMKRVNLCIYATAEVAKIYPEVKLAIIGYGRWKVGLKRLVNKLGVKSNVMFVDKDVLYFEGNEKDQKVKFMQKAWALLIPSVKEGWGMVVNEANACGTLAIGTDTTGLRDSIINNQTGIIISNDKPLKPLVNAMLEIIENQKKRLFLSQQAIKWSENFDWEKSYQEFREILCGLL